MKMCRMSSLNWKWAWRLVLSCLLCLVLQPVGAQSTGNGDGAEAGRDFLFADTSADLDRRVDDLLRRLTLDEKLSMLQHRTPAIPRLGLPAYSWWNEALHGVGRNGEARVYPMPMALAATFDTALVGDVYREVAREARHKHATAMADGRAGDDYVGLTFFAPNVNLTRDPRWGRAMETFGEDPCLTAYMGAAVVRGLQGDDPRRLTAAACLKHFAVHSGPEASRHAFDAQVSDVDLWTDYLPAFHYLVTHTDVQQVMCAYNRLNGEPCCTSRELHRLLREEWGFGGVLVTDCWALNDCWERDTVVPRHETHASASQAAAAAFGGEVDLECGNGLDALRTALDSGLLSEADVDHHVARVLRLRLRVGVDEVAGEEPPATRAVPSEAESWLPYRAAAESLVLLKNNGVLPLSPSGTLRVAVVGPNVNDSLMPLGNYSGTPRRYTTVGESLCRTFGPQTFCAEVASLTADEGGVARRFWREVRRCDVVLFVGGLSPAVEGEELPVSLPGFDRGDRTCLELPEAQRRLLHDLKRRTGKPVVLVICTGSGVALGSLADEMDAVMVAWYGGEAMGEAVADAVAGRTNCFGRLPVTFYRSTRQLPPFEDYAMRGRTYRHGVDYPQFPFGFGLDYDGATVDTAWFDHVQRRLWVRVSGREGAQTVVQVYLRNEADTLLPGKRLVAFRRVTLVDSAATERDADGRLATTFELTPDPYWFTTFDSALRRPKPIAHGTLLQLLVGTSSDDFDLLPVAMEFVGRP